MHISKDLLLACSTDITRPVQCHIYADVEKRCAVATDGTVLVCHPIIPDEGEASGYIPRAAIEYAAQQQGNLRGRLFHGEVITTVLGAHFPNPFVDDPDGPPKFVQYEELFITHSSSVRLNVVLLSRLARALCASGTKQEVTMYFTPGTQQVELRADKGGGRGLLAQLFPQR